MLKCFPLRFRISQILLQNVLDLLQDGIFCGKSILPPPLSMSRLRRQWLQVFDPQQAVLSNVLLFAESLTVYSYEAQQLMPAFDVGGAVGKGETVDALSMAGEMSKSFGMFSAIAGGGSNREVMLVPLS
jgi:hypothetical protein